MRLVTDSTLMTSRTRVTSSGSSPSRRKVTETEVPMAPRSFSDTWVTVRPEAFWPSMAEMMSPAWTPARAAGLPSIGEMTLTRPPSAVIVRPTPEYSPEVRSCRSSNPCGGR